MGLLSDLPHPVTRSRPLLSRRHSGKLTLLFIAISVFTYWNFYWRVVPGPPFTGQTRPLGAFQCNSPRNITITNDKEPRQPIRLLPFHRAEALCSAHNLPVYQNRTHPRKVYDLFLFNSELDWLDIRLNELRNHVDYFVMLESRQTFTGYSKPLYLEENMHCFGNFTDQMIYHSLDLGDESSKILKPTAWAREKHMRNALLTDALKTARGGAAPSEMDVLLVSDVDEIPRPETIEVLRNCDFPQRTNLRSRFFYYAFQWQHSGKDWQHPQATYYLGPKDTLLPEDLRLNWRWAGLDMWNSSWHCSSCFATVAEMQYKIASFSHQEYNKKKYRDPGEVVRKVRNGLDLFDRWGETYVKQDPVEDFPAYLKREENRDKYKFLLDRSAGNANFLDV